MGGQEYWVWLQAALGQASTKPLALIEKFGGVRGVYDAAPLQLAQAGSLTKREIEALSSKSLEKSKAIVEACASLGYRILTLDDEDYPRRLRDIFAPPCALYIWGTLPPVDDRVLIAMVGTRRITEYGYEAATKLATGLAQCGATVVSGLAVGVDGAAHRGALKGGGKTIAVIGCGPDINYPSQHEELRRLISKNGAIVSEYPPGTRADRIHFPLRNRIIAGLSLGTVVVEAGSRSGSLITASLAAEMGRDVFAVPGSIFSEVSQGANRLIRDGAKPVCTALDVLEEYIGLYPQTITLDAAEAAAAQRFPDQAPPKTSAAHPAPPLPTPAHPLPQGLTATQEAVYMALNSQPQQIDVLALQLNLELRVLLAVMTTLEIQGLARSLPGRRYVRAY
ncbi:MAG: DNA-processing protein DprA [Clostridia bacterium]|nr:DNA-processing protein DprA [Clostridia bacterium]MDR3644832.1 DNA-processing protein DprA [Clostridia bacterium]